MKLMRFCVAAIALGAMIPLQAVRIVAIYPYSPLYEKNPVSDVGVPEYQSAVSVDVYPVKACGGAKHSITIKPGDIATLVKDTGLCGVATIVVRRNLDKVEEAFATAEDWAGSMITLLILPQGTIYMRAGEGGHSIQVQVSRLFAYPFSKRGADLLGVIKPGQYLEAKRFTPSAPITDGGEAPKLPDNQMRVPGYILPGYVPHAPKITIVQPQQPQAIQISLSQKPQQVTTPGTTEYYQSYSRA